MANDLLETFELESRCLIKSSSRIFAKEYVQDGVPFFRSKDVIDKALGMFSGYDLFISHERYEELKKSHGSPSKGDLLISSVGNRSGQPYVVQDEGDFYFKDGNIIWISDFKDIDSNFLAYWFKSNIGQSRLASVMIGSAQKALTINSIRTLTVTFPIFANQKAIAHILGSLDDKIELNRQMNETLEAMAQALFKSWFVDFDPVLDNALAAGNAIPDEFAERAEQRKKIEKKDNSDIQCLFPDEFEFTEEMGWIPRGWGVSSVGTEFNTVGGGTPSTKNPDFWENGDISWTTPKDLSGNQSKILLHTDRKITELGLNKISSGLLPIDTVLMSSRAPVGYLALAKVPVAINQGYIALKCEKTLTPEFAIQWADSVMDEIKQRAGGTTFAEISKTNFRGIPILVPSKNTIDAYSRNVKDLYNQITSRIENIDTLAKLRDTLLPKLMSGEIRIPDAAALVEEI